MRLETHELSGDVAQSSLFGEECNFAQKPSSSLKIATTIGHFALDQGFSGMAKFLFNGLDYRLLYQEFCESHPQIKISFKEFETLIIESIKRTTVGTCAEAASLAGTTAAVMTKNIASIPNEEMFWLSFIGINGANFLTFAIGWYTSHREQFRKQDGSFDVELFVRSFFAEYVKHFVGIAIGADVLESFIIHELVNNTTWNEYVVALPVTLFCSCVAVGLYFYEQQLRGTIKNTPIGRILNAVRVRTAQMYLPG